MDASVREHPFFKRILIVYFLEREKNMDNKEFYINCDGIALHAKLDFPEDQNEKYPLVIIIHGLTGHMEERHIVEVSKACNSIGFASLRVDMYGHGKSEGEFRNHTVLHWMLEIMRVIDYAKTLDFVTDIYLTGHSQGGASIVLAAALKQESLKAIMPLSPAMMIRDAARAGELPNTAFNPDNPEEILLFGTHAISANYMRVCRLLPFEDAVKDFKKPVLVVHADTDELVPYACAVKLQKDYADAKLVTVPGDDHCYARHLDMVTDAVKEFLLQMNEKKAKK